MPKIRLTFRTLLDLLFYVFLILALLNFLSVTIKAILLPYQLDSVEGQIMEQAIMISRGENIYRPDISTPPYTVANYTPIYMLVLSPFMAIWGPNFWAGRLISTISTLLSAGFLALIIWSISKNIKASLATAGLFLSFPTIVYWTMLVRIDMLGLMFCLAGLWLFIRSKSDIQSLFWVSVLLVMAVYTRQTYGLAAPGAILISLALKKNWKLCSLFFIFYACIGIVTLLLLNTLSQGGFIYQILQSNLDPWHSLNSMWGYYLIFGFLIAGMAYLLVTRQWLRDWTIPVLFLIGGCITASTIGKLGANVNYFNEFTSGVCLLIGMIISLAGVDRRKQAISFTIAVLLTGIFLLSCEKIAIPLLEDRSSPELQSNFIALRSLVHNSNGPVITDEYNGILVVERQQIYIYTSNMTTLSKLGLWDQKPFLKAISQKEFPYIFMTQTSEEITQTRWTPEMMAAIQTNYHIREILGFTAVYAPNTTP